ncbi:MAG TPA: class D sortase [Thermoanaerobaculia bacterium]|nr:class D sortase [Thermoanaerobaculia bacterium]
MDPGPSTTRPKRAALRWVERALLLIGLVCLGTYAYSILDARVSEMRQNEELEAALAARKAAAPPPAVPAQETQALADFREDEEQEPAAPEATEPEPLPVDDGSLVGRLEVPRLGLSAIVREGVAATTLRRGAGRIPGTALPWESGNVGIAAHRDRVFRPLKDIGKNDIITLTTVEGTYRYQVEWTRIVTPKDTQVLHGTTEPALTLVTCYPFYYVGSAPKRFIVRAKRIESPEPAA